MQIIAVEPSQVTVLDGRERSTVFREDNGKWKCLSCSRRRCEHARFVQEQNPALPERPSLRLEDVADLIDE